MEPKPPPARQIPWTRAAGQWQMAADLYLLEASVRHPHPRPVLRFYSWEQDTLSIGHHQALHRLPPLPPLPRIRRPTGGRAVFHPGSLGAELTYSLVMPPSPHTAGSRVQVYWRLCHFLLHGLAQLGVELDPAPPQPSTRVGSQQYPHHTSCFATRTPADLTYHGLKLMGNAQLWRQGHVLQQGTLLLDPDREQWETLLPGSTTHIIGLTEILKETIPLDELQTLFTQAAAHCFPYHWHCQPWTAEEITQIEHLAPTMVIGSV